MHCVSQLCVAYSSTAQAALEDALDSTNLGDAWFERGELAEARYEHTRALKIRTANLRPGHPDVAESLESLGNVSIREVKICCVVCFICCVPGTLRLWYSQDINV